MQNGDQTINGVFFRQHGNGWYPRRCSMCTHYRYDRPYNIANYGNGVVDAWWDYTNEEGDTIACCEVKFPDSYIPLSFPESLCVAYPSPNGFAGEPLNLTCAGVRVSEEVPDWCERFAFFFESEQSDAH